MARLLGIIANRPDLCHRFAEYETQALKTQRSDDEQWGWGVGFFHGGEILLKRRPLDDRQDIHMLDMLDDVRSDILVSHVRHATVGARRTDNTHPFRYRNWLFADTGTVAGWGEVRTKLYETLPRFLQRSLRGDTDSEHFFHLFLSFLHDVGKLDRPNVPVPDVFSALKSSLGLLDRICKGANTEGAQLNILLATPEYLVAARRGAPMAYRRLQGRDDFEPLFGDTGAGKLRMPDLEPCRLASVASDFIGDEIPPDWTEVPLGAMVAFNRTDEPTILEP